MIAPRMSANQNGMRANTTAGSTAPSAVTSPAPTATDRGYPAATWISTATMASHDVTGQGQNWCWPLSANTPASRPTTMIRQAARGHRPARINGVAWTSPSAAATLPGTPMPAAICPIAPPVNPPASSTQIAAPATRHTRPGRQRQPRGASAGARTAASRTSPSSVASTPAGPDRVVIDMRLGIPRDHVVHPGSESGHGSEVSGEQPRRCRRTHSRRQGKTQESEVYFILRAAGLPEGEIMAGYYEPSGGYGEHRYRPGQATVPAGGQPAHDPWNDPWAAPPPPTSEWPGYSGYPGYPGYPPPPPPRRHPFRGLLIALLLLVVVAASGAALTKIFLNATSANQGAPSAGNAPGYGAPAPGGAPGNNGSNGAPLDAQSVAASVNPWVVNIETTLGLQRGGAAGTGIVLTSSGDVLTNNHVIAGSTAITGTDVGNGQAYQATVLGYDRGHDLAVIHLQGASRLRTAAIGDSSKVSVGDGIVAVGNAGGRGGTPTAVSGTVMALEQTITASDENGANAEQLTGLIQVAANIEPGDSGGPLVDAAGQAIGIDTAASTDFRFQASGGQGFAIPINQAVTIAKQIQAGKASSTVHIGATAFLGVQVTGTGGGNGSGNGSGGAVVAGVVQGSPADSAGLSRGDVIVSVDGTTIDTPTALTDTLTGHHPGDRVTIGWVDQTGQSQSQSVRLTTGPAG